MDILINERYPHRFVPPFTSSNHNSHGASVFSPSHHESSHVRPASSSWAESWPMNNHSCRTSEIARRQTRSAPACPLESGTSVQDLCTLLASPPPAGSPHDGQPLPPAHPLPHRKWFRELLIPKLLHPQKNSFPRLCQHRRDRSPMPQQDQAHESESRRHCVQRQHCVSLGQPSPHQFMMSMRLVAVKQQFLRHESPRHR